MTRRELTTMLIAMAVPAPALADDVIPATLYKNPQCTCCEGYAKYMNLNGFKVEVIPTHNLSEISRMAGVPENLQGCHTTMIQGYVVDGHVPVETVRKLLREKPAVAGITLPGMPSGSPGMDGPKEESWTVYAVTKDGKPPSVFVTI
jgi:hypothetical protein